MRQGRRLSGTTRLTQFARQLIVLEKSLESLRGSQLPEGSFQRDLSISSDFRRERTGRGRPAGRNESPGFLRDTSYLERDAQPSAYCNPQQQLERKIGGMSIDDFAECGLRHIELFCGSQLTDAEPLRVARNLKRDVATQCMHCLEIGWHRVGSRL